MLAESYKFFSVSLHLWIHIAIYIYLCVERLTNGVFQLWVLWLCGFRSLLSSRLHFVEDLPHFLFLCYEILLGWLVVVVDVTQSRNTWGHVLIRLTDMWRFSHKAGCTIPWVCIRKHHRGESMHGVNPLLSALDYRCDATGFSSSMVTADSFHAKAWKTAQKTFA